MRAGPLACSLDSIAAAAGEPWSHETNADSRWVLLAYELVFASVQGPPEIRDWTACQLVPLATPTQAVFKSRT